jgi:hypothetical protein
MPRVIVTSDPTRIPPHASVLLDEQVSSVHLGSGHAAAQLIERLAWAISDAEASERTQAGAPGARHLAGSRSRAAGRTRRRSPAAA